MDKMNKITSYGFIRNGELKILGRKRMDAEVKSMPDMDVEIIIKKRGKASDQQRRYYFGVVVKEITLKLIEMGNDVDEEVVHEYLKSMFNKVYIRNEDGVVIGDVGGTTTDQNVSERSEYIDKCVRFAAESLGLVIPAPNTQAAFF